MCEQKIFKLEIAHYISEDVVRKVKEIDYRDSEIIQDILIERHFNIMAPYSLFKPWGTDGLIATQTSFYLESKR